jgi:hypothetical protein
MNKKKKRTYKVEDALDNPLIKPLVKTYSSIKTGDDKFDANMDKLMVEVQFAKIRANRKELSKQYGKKFDVWYNKVKDIDFIKEGQKKLIHHLKNIRKFKLKRQKLGEGFQAQLEDHRQQLLNDKTLYPSLKDFDKLKAKQVGTFFRQWHLPSNPSVASYYFRMSPLNKAYYDETNKNTTWYKISSEPFTTKQAQERNEQYRRVLEFRERHYWLPLTNQEKLYISQNNKKLTTGRYTYAGKPLSKLNHFAVQQFAKQYNENPSQFNIEQSELERIAEKETIKIGKAIMDMMSPKFTELMGFKKFAENGTKVSTNTNPNTKADAVVEVKGNQLNVEMGQKFQATTIGTNFPPQLGLNAYVKRKKLKYALDLPEAYLDDVKKGIVDLKVFDFQSITALANTIGMLPQDLFIVACQHIVKRKKHYKDQMMIMLSTAVEELVELYNNRAEASIKKWDIKLSVRRFFKSAERIAWSKKYEYDWKSHVRFNEDFKEWRTIVSAKAVKKTN